MNSTNSSKMYIIFYILFSSVFNFGTASIEYIDKESDDLTNLSKKFNLETIQNYTEDLSLESQGRLKLFNEQIEEDDFSLENDLIPHVVRTVASEALMASVKIMKTCLDESTILYLGRSPSILLTASNFLESHVKIEKKLNHVQINFSGTPNISNVRHHEVNDLRNVVTPERLNHFYSYLDSKGLADLTPNSQLYVVDQVGKGAGMNAFLRILRQYYISYKDLENTPKVTLLLMNFNNKEIHLEKDCYFYNPKTSDFIFCQSAATKVGYRAMKVKAIGLEMSEEEGGALDAMDDEAVQYFLLKGREYPAFYWSKEYDKYRDSDPELSETFTNSLIQRLKILTSK